MSDIFEVRVDEWLPCEFGSAVERATLAEIGIQVDGYCATEVEDVLAKSVRKTARLSAFHLALWFAANWWRLRWEPEAKTSSWKMSHNMGATGRGFVWPNLTFCSDGSAVFVQAQPTESRNTEPIRYLSQFGWFISANAFEKGIDEFIETVIARLASERLNEMELTALWSEVCQERRDAQKASWRKLEAILGFDPDEAPVELVNRLKDEFSTFGPSAVEEIAAASKADAVSHLQLLADNGRENSVPIEISCVDILRRRINDEIDASLFPWQRADEAAAIARETWSLGKGPITIDTLSDLFKITKAFLENPEDAINVPMPAGFRYDDSAEQVNVFLKRKHPTGRRFALARLVADHLDSKVGERLLPATDKKTQRQKFQRAFAQEFLCPFHDLMEFLGSESPSDDDIEDAADHFEVSPLLVKTTLVNKDVIEREALGA